MVDRINVEKKDDSNNHNYSPVDISLPVYVPCIRSDRGGDSRLNQPRPGLADFATKS
jgi:hypothetical protein